MERLRVFGRWCRRHPTLAGIGGAVLAVLMIAGAIGNATKQQSVTAAPLSPSAPASTPTPTRSSLAASVAPFSAAPADQTQASSTTALALLDQIVVKGRAATTGYTRAAFGTAWTDTNTAPNGGNGCDTRNDILLRDLTTAGLTPGSSCTVATGVLHDPYTDTTITVTRGVATSSAIQIDHVVALSNAWQTGAAGWTEATRTDFANDPLNLLAVDGPTNQAKGDGDAATWLPPNKAYRCAYVARQVAVKARYRLWMTAAERGAIAGILGTCPSQLAPAEDTPARVTTTEPTPTPTPTLTPTPTPQTTTEPPVIYTPPPAEEVYYPNCAAARAAGAAPIYAGQPGYRPGLDRDHDGIACE